MSAPQCTRVASALARLYFGRRRLWADLSPRTRRHHGECRHWGWEHNVIGVGVGTKIVKRRRRSVACVTIFVRRKRPADRLHPAELIPDEVRLEGVGRAVTDVVEVGGPFSACGNELLRPVQPGAQVGHVNGIAGSAGVIVLRADGASLLVSCSHVLARAGRLLGPNNAIEQPFDSDGLAGPNVIGQLEPGFTVLRPSGTGANLEDFAAARLTSSPKPEIVGTAVHPTTVLSQGQIQPGARVRLFGCFARAASGRILSGPIATRVDMPFAGSCDLAGAIPYQIASRGGDSGGAVVLEASPTTLVGLHVAGSPGGIGLLMPIDRSLASRGYRLA